MIRHEDIGVKYLLENGYKKKDIRINNGLHDNVGIPDIITTNNNVEWEVKKIIGNEVSFTYAQYLYFGNNVNILIFKKCEDGYKFTECIDWFSLKHSEIYNININLEVTIDEAYNITHIINKHNTLSPYSSFHKELKYTHTLAFTYRQFLSLDDDKDIMIYRERKLLCTIKWKELKEGKDYNVRVEIKLKLDDIIKISDVIKREQTTRMLARDRNVDEHIKIQNNYVLNHKKYGKEYFKKYGIRKPLEYGINPTL